MVSSTYTFHGVMCSFKVASAVISNSTVNVTASTGPNREPITIPSAN